MAGPRVIHLDSIAALRARTAAWDDLWWRSDATMPTLRAELIAMWLEHFAPRAHFHALLVEDQGQLVAALPLVGRRVGQLLSAGATVGNPWSSSADVLWDAALVADDAIGDCLAAALGRLPWQLLWLEGAALDAPQWHALRRALGRTAAATVSRPRWQTARLAIDHDWNACRQRWSQDLRRKMVRGLQRCAADGEVTLELVDRLAADEVERRLREAFAVEDAGWKGVAGSSVLRTPGMFAFFLRQAQQLARWDQLALAMLRSGRAPLAFCYGLAAKGVFHSCKVGFDPQFGHDSPGQLLRYCLIERLQNDAEYRALDFVGPINEAQRRWHPQTYPVGRLMVAPRRWLGRMALRTYARCWPRARGAFSVEGQLRGAAREWTGD